MILTQVLGFPNLRKTTPNALNSTFNLDWFTPQVLNGVRMLRLLFLNSVVLVLGCSGAGQYQGVLNSGMDGSPLTEVRVVAKASPMPPDMTCQVREVTTGLDGTFTFLDLCRDQKYIMNIPAANLQLSGTISIAGQEIPEPIAHQAWRSPDGHGAFRLHSDGVSSIPTFSDVSVDQSKDGTKVRYPDMKPTGRVIIIGPGEHLVLSGKRVVQKLQILPLVAHPGRVNLEGDTIRNHVFIGVQFDAAGKATSVGVEVDASKITEVLIRGEGMQFIAHDALPEGRYALLGEKDTRVTILDFGSSQAPAK
jgi:hypothetical protein